MKPNRNLLPAATGLFGLLLGVLLGLALAPAFRKQGTEILPATAASLPQSAKSPTPNQDDPKTNLRTRAKERVEDKKLKEPRVSIPLRTVVETLKKDLRYNSDFISLDSNMGKALTLIGATDREQEELKALVKKSKADMLAAEKTHIKLGEVTADKIQMDMRAMRGPAADIAGQIKDGIRAALPPDLAEALVSAIDWDGFYPTNEKSYTHLEITRKPSGRLTAWEKQEFSGTGMPVPGDLKDDGTPMPADHIFPDRWKPFLKGVTILPKDEE